MAVLIAPNGVLVRASELDTPILLAAGYRRAEEEQGAAKRAATRKKRTAKE